MKHESGPGRQMDTKRTLALILVAGIAVRLVLAPLFSFNIDITYWMKVFNLIDSGSNLYGMDGYYYAPVWGYVLGLMDWLAHLFGVTEYGTLVPDMYPYMGRDYSISEYVTSIGFNVMVKFPLILSDIATGYLLYGFVKRIADEKKALIACALWMLCPLTILESSVHGMFDTMSAMFMLMAFIAAYDRRYILAGAVYSLAILTKFFPIFLIFLMFAIVFRNEGISNNAFRKTGAAIASAVITMIIVELPAIVHGQFWDSLNFLLVRVGLSAGLMDSIMGPLAYVLVALFVLAVCGLIHYLCRVRPDIITSRFIDITRGERERIVRKFLKIAAIVLTVLIVIYAVITTLMEDSFDIVNRGGVGLAEAVENDEPGVKDCARTNFTALVESYRARGGKAPIRAVILGCTHYPFVLSVFKETLEELRRDPAYRGLLADDLVFVDPAVYTAIQCFSALKKDGLLNAGGGAEDRVKAFMSVGKNGPLSYAEKYGRSVGQADIGTMIVPMTRKTMTPESVKRLAELLPASAAAIFP